MFACADGACYARAPSAQAGKLVGVLSMVMKKRAKIRGHYGRIGLKMFSGTNCSDPLSKRLTVRRAQTEQPQARAADNQARNRWRWWRRRRKNVTVSLDATDEQHEQPLAAHLADERSINPEQATLARERERILTQALRSLSRVYREVVVLRDVEGLSYEEVAATLAISVGTVKSRLSRGRTELRRRLEGFR